MLDSKIYKHYPVKTEQEKESFLRENYMKVWEYYTKKSSYYEAKLLSIEAQYIETLKKEVTLLGNVNYKNIIHNKHVSCSMERDSRIGEIKNRIEKIHEILCKFEMHEKISIEEINTILEEMNHTYKYNVRKAELVICFLTGIGFYYLMQLL